MTRVETDLPAGTRVVLTSLRTSREIACRIDGPLGAGGTAQVFAGTLEDGSHAVLKCPRFVGEHDQGFENETELYKRLFHRNIIHCVGVGTGPQGQLVIGFRRAYENPLLLMTRSSVVEGMRRDRKARSPSLPLDALIDLGYELLNALEYLEQLGLVHHDVKLANLMIDVAPREKPLEANSVFGLVVRREYRGVLIDFGATRERTFLEALNRGEAPPGPAPQITPIYAPPEAIVESRCEKGTLGHTFDPSLDVYAAAIVLYAMFTGHQPYSHLREPPRPDDLEAMIGVKSAERRGEASPISEEVIQRVVLEDTRFTAGERAAFDLAFHRFLLQRLAPEPATRGSAADMKREFATLMRIRASQGDADAGASAGAGGKRVYLPFVQELVKVGSGGEHPLLTAARLDAADGAAAANESSAAQPPLAPAPGGAARATSRRARVQALEPAPPKPGSTKRPRSTSGRETVTLAPAADAASSKPDEGAATVTLAVAAAIDAATAGRAPPPVAPAPAPPDREPAPKAPPQPPEPLEPPGPGLGEALSLALPLGLGLAYVAGGVAALVGVAGAFVLPPATITSVEVPRGGLALAAALAILAALAGWGARRLARPMRWLLVGASVLALITQGDTVLSSSPGAVEWEAVVSRSLFAAGGLGLLLPAVGRWFGPEGRQAATSLATGLYLGTLACALADLVVLAFVVPIVARVFVARGISLPHETRALVDASWRASDAAPAVALTLVLVLAPLLLVPPRARARVVALGAFLSLLFVAAIATGFLVPAILAWQHAR